MAYEERAYQKFSTENIFTGMIDMDGNIYSANMRSDRTKIGIDAQKEQELLNQIAEMQETLDNYHEKLVELGVIQIPKSPEQIAQEQAEQQAVINQQLLEAIGALNLEIKELKGVDTNGNSRNNTKSSNEPVEQNSADNREKSAAGKGGTRARKAATSAGDE